MAGLPSLIRSKTRIPAVAQPVIARSRVVEELARAAEGRRILEVVASAGSGKTTAVVQMVASRPGPCAWLTLGEADGSPGRLVTYLAAALAVIDPSGPERVAQLLEQGVAPADCAAILVEALPAGATLVIDDLHLVEDRPPALAVLRALTRAVAPETLVVLVSRRMVHLELSRSLLTGVVGSVSGRELAFTADEVETLLAAHEMSGSGEEIAAASGGWAAGIVFDALNGPRANDAMTADDPFFDYLGDEVLSPLSAELRRAVIRSAVLHTVEPKGLEMVLGVPSGAALYGDIRRQQLPATLEPDGLRYHPRFREFLLSVLRQDPRDMSELLVRYAGRLRSEGRVEEAADHLIEAGAFEEAAGAIEEAGPALLQRGDWEKVGAWCELLGEARLSRRPTLRGLQLQAVLLGRRDELPALARTLIASGEYDRLVADAPDIATVAAFGLHLSGDWGRLLDQLPADEASPAARAMRYVLEVGSSEDPPRPWPVSELSSVGPMVGLLQCGLYFSGRLDEVDEMDRIDSGRLTAERVRQTSLYHVASLRERGRLGDARTLIEQARLLAAASGFRDFWRHAEGELVFAEGEGERGLQMVREARLMARESGHQPADRAIFAATEGKLLVRLGRLDEAVDVLQEALTWSGARGLPCFAEWAATWLGAALLQLGDDPAVAADLLESAIRGMERAERRLELPAAWVFLAEARWRLGDEEGHDAAAAAARDACDAIGSLGPLVAALEDVPDVLARCIDAGGPREASWRAVARAGERALAPSSVDGARVVIGTLGRMRVSVDGAERVLSPPLAIDVAAAVARTGSRGVARARLVEMLEEHSSDAQSYLRQLIHRLRRMAPPGVSLTSDDDVLRWTPTGAVVTEDGVLRSLLARARSEVGPGRLRTLSAALDVAEHGPLATAGDNFAVNRLRDELAALVADARREHAELLLVAGRSAEALVSARRSTFDQPLREDGWRTLMRAAGAADGPSAAVPIFAECAAALGEIGLEPSQETRRLLDRLRETGGVVVSPPE